MEDNSSDEKNGVIMILRRNTVHEFVWCLRVSAITAELTTDQRHGLSSELLIV